MLFDISSTVSDVLVSSSGAVGSSGDCLILLFDLCRTAMWPPLPSDHPRQAVFDLAAGVVVLLVLAYNVTGACLQGRNRCLGLLVVAAGDSGPSGTVQQWGPVSSYHPPSGFLTLDITATNASPATTTTGPHRLEAVIRLYTIKAAGDSVVLMYWQHHPGLRPTWYPSLADFYRAYGDYDGHNQQGMRHERLGVDKDYGLTYVFDYRHAKCDVRSFAVQQFLCQAW
jgi:hypothetical protein